LDWNFFKFDFYTIFKMNQQEQAKDLKQYYKLIYKCSKCGIIYGSDEKDLTKLCPDCMKKGGNKK